MCTATLINLSFIEVCFSIFRRSQCLGGPSARRPPLVNKAINRFAAETEGVSHVNRWLLFDTNYLLSGSGGATAV